MIHRRACVASLVTFVGLAGASYAADTNFQVVRIAESLDYERPLISLTVGGAPAGATTVRTSRVTVVLDGYMIAGEWEPRASISISSTDFPAGADVEVAATREELLLKHADGSVVRARIVARERLRKLNRDESD